MARIVGFHPALTDLDTTPQVALGGILEADNKTYKYVKFSGTTAIAVGDALCYVASDTSLNTVDGALTDFGAGVALAVVGTGTVQYGFILIKGVVTLSGTIGGTCTFGNVVTTAGTNASAGHVGLQYAAGQQGVGLVINDGTAGACIIDSDFAY